MVNSKTPAWKITTIPYRSGPYWPDYLQWIPSLGVGYFPVDEYLAHEKRCKPEEVYKEEYYDKYQEMERTRAGKEINEYRVGLVAHYTDYYAAVGVLDYGCGCGTFLKFTEDYMVPYGYDINPKTVQMLKKRGIYYEHGKDPIPNVVCFWDSFEHIPDIMGIDVLRDSDVELAFMTIPIFENRQQILTSKHFRMDEHFWYFTRKGLGTVMKDYGFEEIHWDGVGEQRFGREGVETFVFERRQ